MDKDKIQERIAGLIYAGGRGQRMGGVDKAFIIRNDKPMIENLSEQLSPMVEKIYITRQKDQRDVSAYGEVVFDQDGDAGPLCGLVSVIPKARDAGFHALLTIAIDGLSLPANYLQKMQAHAKPHAMAKTGDQIHPTYGFINLNKADEVLLCYANGERRLRAWLSRDNCAYVEFATGDLANFNHK